MNQSDRPIADSYWVDPTRLSSSYPGRLLAGEYPGALAEAQARQKLSRLLRAGVRAFIDLTEPGEYDLRPYWPQAQQLASVESLPVSYQRWPIPDLGTPTDADMVAVLDVLDRLLQVDQVVYVHCFGGIGRTGTVVGCYLVRHGLTGAAALAALADWRRGTPDGHRPSPETPGQRGLILGWQPGR